MVAALMVPFVLAGVLSLYRYFPVVEEVQQAVAYSGYVDLVAYSLA